MWLMILFLFWKNGNIFVFATGWWTFLVLICYLFWSTERERCIYVIAMRVTYQHVNSGRHFSNNSVLCFVFVIKLVLSFLFVTVLVPFCRRLTGWWGFAAARFTMMRCEIPWFSWWRLAATEVYRNAPGPWSEHPRLCVLSSSSSVVCGTCPRIPPWAEWFQL